MLPVQVKSPLLLVTVQPVAPEPPAKRTSPVEVPAMETVPLPLASRVKEVLVVEAEMAGEAPAKVKAVELKILVL